MPRRRKLSWMCHLPLWFQEPQVARDKEYHQLNWGLGPEFQAAVQATLMFSLNMQATIMRLGMWTVGKEAVCSCGRPPGDGGESQGSPWISGGGSWHLREMSVSLWEMTLGFSEPWWKGSVQPCMQSHLASVNSLLLYGFCWMPYAIMWGEASTSPL